MTITLVLLILVLLAGFYMAWNIGANDVANAIGTSVGSGSLTLKQAVVIAAVLEFAGAYFFGGYVTSTIQKGIVDPQIFSEDPLNFVYGMLASLIAAGLWLNLASYFGWPVSTTQTIVGAIVGFGAVVGGVDAIHWSNVATIFSSWVLSPLLGGILAFSTFSLMRRHIFFTSNPIRATKRLAPILVFVILTFLSLIMIFRGLNNFDIKMTFFHSLFISILIGALSGFILFLFIRNIPERSKSALKSYNPLFQLSLAKARKHLRHVQASCPSDLVDRLSTIIDDIKVLDEEVKNTPEPEETKSEYAVVEKVFGYLQIITACMMAFAHGSNDVANAIGPVVAAIEVLNTSSIPEALVVPTWTLAWGGFGIIVGLAMWGWRVVETIGKKITELTPTRGFAAELGAAATIVVATRLGLPISTTQTLVGAVIGVGLGRGLEAIDLSKTRAIFLSWIVTVPAGFSLSVGIYYLITAIMP